MGHARKKRLAVGAAFLLVALAASAEASQEEDSFFDLDLKEVLNLEITSVSKKPQTVSQAAAAVFVITADDIRRSGAATIAELLRMSPGLQVGQISASAWGISARGSNGHFANKLLVLVDGRSVYTTSFSGVYWDVQDTLLADIERIEVIRGPGAALWGANAVNGVINIITKSAAATQGGLVSLVAGGEESVSAALRYGGKIGDAGHWRAYVKGFERDGSIIQSTGEPGHDRWRQGRLGFRTDLASGAQDKLTLQGDYYKGRSGETAVLSTYAPPYNVFADTWSRVSGWNLLARWQHQISVSDSFTLQAYTDRTVRDWPGHMDESHVTYDLDFQYRTQRFAGHDIVVGAGYRQNRDRSTSSYTGIPLDTIQFTHFSPANSTQQLFSFFLQDDITLVQDKLVLTLGGKLEKNPYTGLEHQPNVRLLWTPDEASSLWASVARAVRTPSRIDRGGTVNFTIDPPTTALPFLPLAMQANWMIDAEYLMAYEAGWKQRVTPALSFDLSLFYNNYTNIRSTTLMPMTCQPSGELVANGCFLLAGQTHFLYPMQGGNHANVHNQGMELAADWRALPNLRFQLAGSLMSMRAKANEGASTTDLPGSAPKRQWAVRMAWNPHPDVDVDFSYRYVSRLADFPWEGQGISAYRQADMRLGWRVQKNLEIALVGRNLLKSRHQEFVSELYDVPPMLMQRSFFGQVNFKF